MKKIFSIYRVTLSNEYLKIIEDFLKDKHDKNQEAYAYIEYCREDKYTLLGYEVQVIIAQPIDPNDFYSEDKLDWGEVEDIWNDSDSGWEYEIDDIKEKHKKFEEFCTELRQVQKTLEKILHPYETKN